MKAIGAAQNWDMHMQRASSNMNSYTNKVIQAIFSNVDSENNM